MAQEQCMKDSGNLVAIENTQEQIFLTNYLKRHGEYEVYLFYVTRQVTNTTSLLVTDQNNNIAV